MIMTTGHHVAGASHELVDDLTLGEATHDADDDGEEQEPGRGLGEVPLAERGAVKRGPAGVVDDLGRELALDLVLEG